MMTIEVIDLPRSKRNPDAIYKIAYDSITNGRDEMYYGCSDLAVEDIRGDLIAIIFDGFKWKKKVKSGFLDIAACPPILMYPVEIYNALRMIFDGKKYGIKFKIKNHSNAKFYYENGRKYYTKIENWEDECLG